MKVLSFEILGESVELLEVGQGYLVQSGQRMVKIACFTAAKRLYDLEVLRIIAKNNN